MKKVLPLLIVIGLFLIGYFSTSIIINKNRKEYKKNNSSIEPIIITTYSKVNGNKIADLIQAFDKAKTTKGKPTAIVAITTKGKGVSFMENQASWHGKAPNEEQYKQAMEELQ